MPRLIPPEMGNGKRPSSPDFKSDAGLPPEEQSLVPVLDVSEDTHDLIGQTHDAALDPDDDTELLTGQVVYLHNGRPRNVVVEDAPPWTKITIGGSTLHEAATECVGVLTDVALDMPEWVASTDKRLAQVLAEHFTIKNESGAAYSTCKVIKMSEVPS